MTEVIKMKLELQCVKLELENERKAHGRTRGRLDETEEQLFETLERLEETQERLDEAHERLDEVLQMLKYAKMELAEKDELIREMEDSLIKRAQPSDEGVCDMQFSVYSSTTSPSDEYRCLSPIPEENPDEIPGYYDECDAYNESLKIVIGSDSILSFNEDLDVIHDLPSEVTPKYGNYANNSIANDRPMTAEKKKRKIAGKSKKKDKLKKSSSNYELCSTGREEQQEEKSPPVSSKLNEDVSLGSNSSDIANGAKKSGGKAKKDAGQSLQHQQQKPAAFSYADITKMNAICSNITASTEKWPSITAPFSSNNKNTSHQINDPLSIEQYPELKKTHATMEEVFAKPLVTFEQSVSKSKQKRIKPTELIKQTKKDTLKKSTSVQNAHHPQQKEILNCRPATIILNNCIKSSDADGGITFGFDINEHLLIGQQNVIGDSHITTFSHSPPEQHQQPTIAALDSSSHSSNNDIHFLPSSLITTITSMPRDDHSESMPVDVGSLSEVLEVNRALELEHCDLLLPQFVQPELVKFNHDDIKTFISGEWTKVCQVASFFSQ